MAEGQGRADAKRAQKISVLVWDLMSFHDIGKTLHAAQNAMEKKKTIRSVQLCSVQICPFSC